MGVVLSSKYKSIYSRSNRLVGLLDILLVDETWVSSTSPLLLQIWGQSASDRHRFNISAGCIIVVQNGVVSAGSVNDQTMLRGDIAFIRGRSVNTTPEAEAHLSDHIRTKLTRLTQWVADSPLPSLVRKAPVVALRVSSLADIIRSTDKQLFTIVVTISKEQLLPTGEDSVCCLGDVCSNAISHIVEGNQLLSLSCTDSCGATVRLQLCSLAQLNDLIQQTATLVTTASTHSDDSEQISAVPVELRQVSVGYAYHGEVK